MNGRVGRWATPILSILGIAVAAYLTYVHYQHDALVCGLGDCSLVQTSSHAEVLGIPVAILGLLMYIALLGLSLLRIRLPERSDLLDTAIVSIALAGVAYAAYLTYVEIWVIEAICQWCVLSAVITTAILAFEAARFWAAPPSGIE
jgi:uncharacterized membrane protein